MDLQIWQVVVAAAIPVFAFLGALVSRSERTPALYRRLRSSTTALKDLPPDLQETRKALERLVVEQVDAIITQEHRRRLTRQHIDWGRVGGAVLVTVLAPVAAWGLLAWIAATWGTWWAWLSVPVSGFVAIGLLVGVFQVWETALVPWEVREENRRRANAEAAADDANEERIAAEATARRANRAGARRSQ